MTTLRMVDDGATPEVCLALWRRGNALVDVSRLDPWEEENLDSIVMRAGSDALAGRKPEPIW